MKLFNKKNILCKIIISFKLYKLLHYLLDLRSFYNSVNNAFLFSAVVVYLSTIATVKVFNNKKKKEIKGGRKRSNKEINCVK